MGCCGGPAFCAVELRRCQVVGVVQTLDKISLQIDSAPRGRRRTESLKWASSCHRLAVKVSSQLPWQPGLSCPSTLTCLSPPPLAISQVTGPTSGNIPRVQLIRCFIMLIITTSCRAADRPGIAIILTKIRMATFAHLLDPDPWIDSLALLIDNFKREM